MCATFPTPSNARLATTRVIRVRGSGPTGADASPRRCQTHRGKVHNGGPSAAHDSCHSMSPARPLAHVGPSTAPLACAQAEPSYDVDAGAGPMRSHDGGPSGGKTAAQPWT